jgi:hypothetical protein
MPHYNRPPRELSFPLGRIVMTANAVEKLSLDAIATALLRHTRGDWGDVSDEDRRLNDSSLLHGLQLHSAYRDRRGASFWVITEGDRSLTTVLLPADY